VDVVVGTPGRIIDLIDQDAMDLSQIKFVILDEADTMLNVGFEKDVETILENVPTERQTMLFSATVPKWVKKLVKSYLKEPVNIDLIGDSGSGKMADSITALGAGIRRLPPLRPGRPTDRVWRGRQGHCVCANQA